MYTSFLSSEINSKACLISNSNVSTPLLPGNWPSLTRVLAANSITPTSFDGNKTRKLLRYRAMLVVVLTTSPLIRHSKRFQLNNFIC